MLRRPPARPPHTPPPRGARHTCCSPPAPPADHPRRTRHQHDRLTGQKTELGQPLRPVRRRLWRTHRRNAIRQSLPTLIQRGALHGSTSIDHGQATAHPPPLEPRHRARAITRHSSKHQCECVAFVFLKSRMKPLVSRWAQHLGPVGPRDDLLGHSVQGALDGHGPRRHRGRDAQGRQDHRADRSVGGLNTSIGDCGRRQPLTPPASPTAGRAGAPARPARRASGRQTTRPAPQRWRARGSAPATAAPGTRLGQPRGGVGQRQRGSSRDGLIKRRRRNPATVKAPLGRVCDATIPVVILLQLAGTLRAQNHRGDRPPCRCAPPRSSPR